MEKPLVIFCTDGIFPHVVGGMQRHSRLLIEELAKRNEVDLIILHPHQSEKLFSQFPHVKEIALNPLPNKKQYLLELYDYSAEVLEVLLQYPKAIIYSQGLSVWKGIDQVKHRLIVNPHGLEPFQTITTKEYLITAPFRLVFNRLFKKARHVVALGGRLTDILKPKVASPKNLIVLPNATNLPNHEPPVRNNDKVKCLFVGRFAFNKGIDVLMETIESLNTDGLGNQFEFFLAGKGPLFEEYTEKYKLPNAHLLGFVSDEQLSQLYHDADVFVFPTLFEGMPTVILEAMAEGQPIIVTDVGATKELVGEENGYIIEKKSVASLKQALLKFSKLTNEEKTALSQASYKKLKENFTWQAVAKRHEKLFFELSKEVN